MSGGNTLGSNIPVVGAMLLPANITPWLKRYVMLGTNIAVALQAAYRDIDGQELQRVRKGQESRKNMHSMTQALRRENMKRNRYTDIIPYDGTRVILREPSDGSDYINASFATGLPGTRQYITSQGPLPNTMGDFWQMAWEQGTAVIVMLTKEEERGRKKCERYWPDTPGSPKRFTNLGGLEIELVEEETRHGGEVVLREFWFRQLEGGNVRRIWLVHFLAWPDHRGSNAGSVLHIVDLAESIQRRAELEALSSEGGDTHHVGPMIVHCSAGCGRTGTFATISGTIAALTRGEGRGDDDLIQQSVERLRECRVSMVQTLEQFAFCYEAVLCRLLEWQHGVAEPPSWVTRQEQPVVPATPTLIPPTPMVAPKRSFEMDEEHAAGAVDVGMDEQNLMGRDERQGKMK
ncbi:hypothetical protein HK104_009963 [Borealophlyctis nickersoniae]|nr:hypothetical protein HK104_009963 [Borealophlyctis nickersoniae]